MNNKTIFTIGIILILILIIIILIPKKNNGGQYYNIHFDRFIKYISSIKDDLSSKYTNDARKKMIWRMRKPIPQEKGKKYDLNEKKYYQEFVPISSQSLSDINDEILSVPKDISDIFNYLSRRYNNKDTTIIDNISRKFYNDLLGAQLYYFIYTSDLPEIVKKDMICCLGLYELTIIQQNPVDYLEKDKVVVINNFIANEIESKDNLLSLEDFKNKIYDYFSFVFDENKLTTIYINNIEYHTGKKTDEEYFKGAKLFVGGLINMIKLRSKNVSDYLIDKDTIKNVIIRPSQYLFIPPKSVFESSEKGRKLYEAYQKDPNVIQQEDPQKILKILTTNTIYKVNTDENQLIDFKEENYNINYMLEHILETILNVDILNLRFPMLLSDWHKFRALPITILKEDTTEEIKKDKITYYALINFAVKTGDLENIKRYNTDNIFIDQRFKKLFNITKSYISKKEFKDIIYNFYKKFLDLNNDDNNKLHTTLFNKYIQKSYNQLNKNNLSNNQNKEKIII